MGPLPNGYENGIYMGLTNHLLTGGDPPSKDPGMS